MLSDDVKSMSFNCEELEVEKSKKYKLLIGYAQAKCSTLEFKIFFWQNCSYFDNERKKEFFGFIVVAVNQSWPDKDKKGFERFLSVSD